MAAAPVVSVAGLRKRCGEALQIVGGALFLFAAGGLELTINDIVPGSAADVLEMHLEEGAELIAATVTPWGSVRLRDVLRGPPS